MAKYVDGFVLVVPKGKEDEYQKMAEMGRDSWMKHGALQYFECKGDDLKPQEMGDEKSRSFNEMADANSDENVWFSFIVFNSKEHRDEVNKKVMAEMNEAFSDQADFEMPSDMNCTLAMSAPNRWFWMRRPVRSKTRSAPCGVAGSLACSASMQPFITVLR